MAASNTSGTGRKNYYNVSYGKLATKVKDIPENHTEIKETELKALTQKVQEIDLRNKFLVKTGEYPYVVFYDKIEGQIQSIKKNDFEKGSTLQIEILDNDDETSFIQCKFYSKYTENVLNRLTNAKSLTSNLVFTPYSMATEFTVEETGQNIKMYNQGVSLRLNGEKIDVKYNKENPGKMPPTERVMNSEGQEQTSRVKRINFLFEEVSKKFSDVEVNSTSKSSTNDSAVDDNDDDLPF